MSDAWFCFIMHNTNWEAFARHLRRLETDPAYYEWFRVRVQRIPYREVYLRSPYWRLTRELLFRSEKLKGHKLCCRDCGRTTNLEVNHLHYERRGLEALHLGDLEILCAKCHREHHAVVEILEDMAQVRIPIQRTLWSAFRETKPA